MSFLVAVIKSKIGDQCCVVKPISFMDRSMPLSVANKDPKPPIDYVTLLSISLPNKCVHEKFGKVYLPAVTDWTRIEKDSLTPNSQSKRLIICFQKVKELKRVVFRSPLHFMNLTRSIWPHIGQPKRVLYSSHFITHSIPFRRKLLKVKH